MSLRRTLQGILLLITAAAPALAAEPTPTRLRVLSYNIHHAEGMDKVLDLPRIGRIIADSKADIVAVQEVDKKTRRVNGSDQPAELAKLSGLPHFVFGKTIDHAGGDYGNLILSRFPIASHKNHTLPNSARAEQRGLLEAEITLPGSAGAIRLFATHLDFGSKPASETDRQQAIDLATQRADTGGQPAIFAGDLNCRPDSETIKYLKKSWLQSNTEEAPTIPVAKPTRQIDFIFLRPEARWRVLSTKVLDEKIASDHLPILAEVEVLPARSN